VNLAWTIEVSVAAERQLSKMDRAIAKRVTRYLIERVGGTNNPRALGKPLQGNLQSYWSYRVGDYRLICEIQDHHLVVLVIDIGHRREVYR
jgi:mRNA interferase RelE/StbE